MLPIRVETLRLIVVGVALLSFLATLNLLPPLTILAVGFASIWVLERMLRG